MHATTSLGNGGTHHVRRPGDRHATVSVNTQLGGRRVQRNRGRVELALLGVRVHALRALAVVAQPELVELGGRAVRERHAHGLLALELLDLIHPVRHGAGEPAVAPGDGEVRRTLGQRTRGPQSETHGLAGELAEDEVMQRRAVAVALDRRCGVCRLEAEAGTETRARVMTCHPQIARPDLDTRSGLACGMIQRTAKPVDSVQDAQQSEWTKRKVLQRVIWTLAVRGGVSGDGDAGEEWGRRWQSTRRGQRRHLGD